MQSIVYDLREGLRLLRRAPLFSALIVGTLALAIGANTAIFSVVNGVLLRALPYEDPSRLVLVYEGLPSYARPFGFSAPDFVGFRERARSYTGIAAFRSVEYELSGQDQPERVRAARVSASLFDLLGVPLAVGRGFTSEEDNGRQPVAILGDALWRRKFGADTGVIGRAITLDRRAYTVVGVLPRGLTFPNRGPLLNNTPADVYVPLSFSDQELGAFASMYNNSVIGRLKPGVSTAQATSEARDIAKTLIAEVYPAVFRENGMALTMRMTPLADDVVGGVRRILYVLLAAVVVVLLIATADITGLMLTRAAVREREMAVRTALGAGRARLIRMMLLEAGVLAGLGGLAGAGLGWWATRVLVSITSIELPRAAEVSVDSRVVFFAIGITLASALLCGIVPAWESSRRQTNTALKESAGRSGTASMRQRRIFGTLVTAQFAFAIVLLTSGGLLIRSFGRLLDTDPGVRRDNVITLSTSLPATTYSKGSDVRAFYQRLLARVGQIPGVSEVATGTDVPLSVRERRAFTVETPNEAVVGLPHVIAHDWVNGKYFDTLGIRLISGRYLTEQDGTGPEPIVVVNETMARRFWPGVNPVGRRMAWGGARTHGPWMRIVGVVADVKQAGIGVPAEPQTWTPWLQLPDAALAENPTGIFRNLTIILRTSVPPESVIASVRQEVAAIDPLLPVSNVKTLDDVLNESTASDRFNASLLGAFAGTALLLAAIGVAGVLAISVSRRTAEIGIRLALGAQSRDVLAMVLRQGLMLVLLGLAIGLPASFFASRLLSTLLFGIGPHDPVAFAGAIVLLLAVALAACAAPAIRASRIDPIAALRID